MYRNKLEHLSNALEGAEPRLCSEARSGQDKLGRDDSLVVTKRILIERGSGSTKHTWQGTRDYPVVETKEAYQRNRLEAIPDPAGRYWGWYLVPSNKIASSSDGDG